MSGFKTLHQTIESLLNALQEVFRYIGIAAIEIFTPTDDQYPVTGVQPFEGVPIRSKR